MYSDLKVVGISSGNCVLVLDRILGSGWHPDVNCSPHPQPIAYPSRNCGCFVVIIPVSIDENHTSHKRAR